MLGITASASARRLYLTMLAVVASALIFRPQVAQALVVRGDDYLYAAQMAGALEHYRRAVALDPDLGIAVDRYIFASLAENAHGAAFDSLRIAGRYLAGHPRDTAVLYDRALCELKLRRTDEAASDFARVAALTHNSQTYVFAGWAARAHNRSIAVRFWRDALRVDRGDTAARAALRAGR